MKLGYFFQVTANGAGSKEFKINCNNWDYYVSDQRDIWYKYASNDECVAITMIEKGILISVVKLLRTARPKDNIATWIYVPSKIKISGEELERVIIRVKEINRGSTKAITETIFASDPILNADFEERKYPRTLCRPEPDSQNAYRTKTQMINIREILDRPFQEYYSNYRYIFLFNEFPATTEGLVDISDKELKKTITALPPSESTIREYFGYAPVRITKDRNIFNSPISVELGDNIKLRAERSGYVSMDFVGQAIEDEAELQLSGFGEWRKIINPHTIIVKDVETGSIISGAKVDFGNCNGYDRMNDSIPESKLANVAVRVTANGYKDKEVTIDFTGPLMPITLEANKEEKTYTLTTDDGRKLKVTFSGKRIGKVCPLVGYTFTGEKLQRQYPSDTDITIEGKSDNDKNSKDKHEFSLKWFLCGILTALLLILLALGVKAIFFSGDKEDKKPAINNLTTPEQPRTDPRQLEHPSTISQAVAYLDNNEVWIRDSINKFPELVGLFDELNSYDFDKIIARETSLSNSKAFKDLVNVVKANNKKRINGMFNNQNDIQITVKKYKNKINNAPYVAPQSINLSPSTSKQESENSENSMSDIKP